MMNHGFPIAGEVVKGYEGFFGFHEAPFSLAPNTRFLFESASYRTVLSQVVYALERREPLVVVTGDIGTGKTLLCRTVLERIERRTFLSVVNDPLLDRDELLKRMLQDFGVISRDRTKLAPTSRHDLAHALQEFLQSLAPLDAHAVLIIDEAHHMQPDALEQIRLISNIHDDRGTMLQIILVGQTDLEALLSKPELRQLRQRVSRRVHLEPLSPAEVAEYVTHRLSVARERHTRSQMPGAQELQREIAAWEAPQPTVTFTTEAIGAVARISGGIPRVVNLLCDRALEAAHARQVRTVDASLVGEATRALDLPAASPATVPSEPEPSMLFGGDPVRSEAPARPARHLVRAGAVIAVLGGIWLAGRTFTGWGTQGSEPEAPASAPATAPAVPSATADTPPASAGSSAAPPAEPAAAPATPAPDAAGTAVPGTGSFEIVVASFRTESRAAAVAAEVAALGQPVRRRVAAGWQQVLAGPFPSRAEADAAQQRLDRAGYTGTQIVPMNR